VAARGDAVTQTEGLEAFDVTVARRASGPLRVFNQAGILSPSDVHVALRLARLSGTGDDDAVLLGIAFAARAPRLGHVCVDLHSIGHTASADSDSPVDVGTLPWPESGAWLGQMTASPLVGTDRPLHLEGSNLYLDRLWADECLVASELESRAAGTADEVDDELLAAGLARLFPGDDDPDLQRLAAATSVLSRMSVIAGGPGTGKTTTVARALALLFSLGGDTRPPLVALAAPTGKAAARLEASVRAEAQRAGLDPMVRERLEELQGSTLHRLLGFNPGNRTRFRHNRTNRLPHDVVVVDETSMVSLSMMARLVEAVRPDARLILVGDPDQLASVEAGAVLGDIVGPAGGGLRMGRPARERLAAVSGQRVPGQPSESAAGGSIGDGIVVLRRVHRFGGAIAELAEAVQKGDADSAVSVLLAGGSNVRWIPVDAGDVGPEGDALGEVRALAVASGRTVIEAARAGRAAEAISALGQFRLLCAHRRGPEGVTTWMRHVEAWLRAEVDGFATGTDWYAGRPLIVTENDYGLQLYNGDTGVVVESGAGTRLVAAFERGGAVAEVSPTRLAAVDTVYAMTVHKSQGSQFHTVAFLLPAAGSRLLTRELLYTAVTRAQERLVLVGTAETVRTAIERPITRASGLRRALWGETA
jgi:exodeoxyribonuclease V alpha subunit